MELLDRFHELSTCQISDGLRACGLPREGLHGINPLEPALPMVGRAMTVVCELVGETGRPAVDFLGSVQRGDVVVLASQGRTRWSVWGGTRSLKALERGAVGAVVDGGYRDLGEHRDLGFPVYGRGPTVASSAQVVVATAVNEPVLISGVVVRAGDYVIGDESGVITVPHEHAEAVADAAEAIAEAERAEAEAITGRMA